YVVLVPRYYSIFRRLSLRADEFDAFAGNVQLMHDELVRALPASSQRRWGRSRHVERDESLRTIDTPIRGWQGHLSLRLSRDEQTSGLYVVFAYVGSFGIRNQSSFRSASTSSRSSQPLCEISATSCGRWCVRRCRRGVRSRHEAKRNVGWAVSDFAGLRRATLASA